ncbi:MAG: NUDIX domain-containing protein [Candidatus Latescibacteria bacterium]|nr:NUDIX domain-containing protein [Candidatus Latescibacterota bacterium]
MPEEPGLHYLPALRQRLAHGDATSQEELEALSLRLGPLKKSYRPGEADEKLALVDGSGQLNGLQAERWLCHLLGLRHRSVHILLYWDSPGLGRVLLLQIRSWSKLQSPGHIDISIGGHIDGQTSPGQAAQRELHEELGLLPTDLEGGLQRLTTYFCYVEEPASHTFDAEWCHLYTGALTTTALERIGFADGEVVGLYACPQGEARGLLAQRHLPLASGLRYSLPRYLKK